MATRPPPAPRICTCWRVFGGSVEDPPWRGVRPTGAPCCTTGWPGCATGAACGTPGWGPVGGTYPGWPHPGVGAGAAGWTGAPGCTYPLAASAAAGDAGAT